MASVLLGISVRTQASEALELVLGAERLFRRPIIDEHDFHNGRYLGDQGDPVLDQRGGFVDVEGANPADLDGPDVCRALPVVFLGWYDRKNDDFAGHTYFAHPAEPVGEEDDRYGEPGAGPTQFRPELEAGLRLHLSPHIAYGSQIVDLPTLLPAPWPRAPEEPALCFLRKIDEHGLDLDDHQKGVATEIDHAVADAPEVG